MELLKICWVSLVEVNLNARLFVLPDEVAFLSLPCTIVANSLGLYFQDDISENAACGTVDGNTTIGTLGDVIIRLKLDHKIMTGPMSSHFFCTTQITRSISGLTILPGHVLNPRLTNFSFEHWFRLQFLKMDTPFACYFFPVCSHLHFLNLQKQQNTETYFTSPHSHALTDWHVASHTGWWQGH